jgi:DNA-binding Lrp family transcriptional regulator
VINLKLEISAAKGMERVNELREAGYIQGIDFDFAYYASIQDRFNGPTKPSYVLFHFYKESLATYYGLKWQ